MPRGLPPPGAAPAPSPAPAPPPPPPPPADFICEDDVRRAAREGRQLRVGPRTIVTPAARDAGAAFDALLWLDGTPR